MTADELAAAVGKAAAQELNNACDRIKHCVAQLSAEQVWWRSDPAMNSIGNLILHLSGNVRQWIVAGVGGAPDCRNRPAEFAERGPMPPSELIGKLDAVVQEATAALTSVTAPHLVNLRRIQSWEVNGLSAIVDCVAHFRGHTQEIIHMTRQQLGAAYRFAWTPETPEQGAPAGR